MEVDPSADKFRQETSWGKNQSNTNYKRQNSSQRQSGPRRQRINNIAQSHEEEDAGYPATAEAEVANIEETSTPSFWPSLQSRREGVTDQSVGNVPPAKPPRATLEMVR